MTQAVQIKIHSFLALLDHKDNEDNYKNEEIPGCEDNEEND